MKKLNIFLLLSLITVNLFPQQKTAESTELYSPVPPVVTPGESSKPPSDAIILFDGTSFDQWVNDNGNAVEWIMREGCMTIKPGSGNIKTKRWFGDCQLHIEWRCPTPSVKKEADTNTEQGFGNSGILLQSRYELQIFDSYNYPDYHNGKPIYVNGQAGSVYKQVIPLVNACKKQGEWQIYDIIYMAPRFSDNGRISIPARITVLHNGVLIINNSEILGSMNYIGLPEYRPHGLKEPLSLQEHGDPVSYRNIWIREL
ncbi:MAG: DUF1080 domain-containing protein [Bacteroidales bacterium]|nr:DUF1080 domain-containing protein [Bacteroidales bacterium]